MMLQEACDWFVVQLERKACAEDKGIGQRLWTSGIRGELNTMAEDYQRDVRKLTLAVV